MKAFFFKDRESVEVDCKFSGEDLYSLWQLSKQGVIINVPITLEGKPAYVDIRALNVNATLVSLMVPPETDDEPAVESPPTERSDGKRRVH